MTLETDMLSGVEGKFTPLHDKWCLYLWDNFSDLFPINIENAIKEYAQAIEDIKQSSHLLHGRKIMVGDIIDGVIVKFEEPEFPKDSVYREGRWEYPLMKSGGSIRGFIDVYVHRHMPGVRPGPKLSYQMRKNDKGDRYYEYITIKPQLVDIKEEFYIEVKPVIRSIGETLRQLEKYRAFVNNSTAKIMVFGPENPDAIRIIKHHGFGYKVCPL